MKLEWKSFLENGGAEFYEQTVESFGNPSREAKIAFTGDVFAVLSHYGLIAVYGNDAETFLQGQFTNDVRQVNESTSQCNAYCNPKGRVITNFRLFKRNDTYYLRLPFDMVEDTLRRLKMYVMRAKVTLDDASNTFASLGYSGPNAIAELENAKLKVPEHIDQVTQTDNLCVIRIPGLSPRFEIYGELDAMKKLWTELNVRGAPVGTSPWQLLDIHAGLPTIRPETSEKFVPQMLNLNLINAVNFKKGCFTGQEIVARMQYLGKLKKRMYLAHIGEDKKPVPAGKLYSPHYSNDQSCGEVVNSQPASGGGYDLLAVIDIKSYEQDDIHYSANNGPKLTFSELPYSFDDPTISAKIE